MSQKSYDHTSHYTIIDLRYWTRRDINPRIPILTEMIAESIMVFNGRYQRHIQYLNSQPPASVAHLDAPSYWRPGGRGFNPRRGRQHSFVEIDHEIFSTVILSLPLIQEGQLSVSGERMCTILVNRLEY